MIVLLSPAKSLDYESPLLTRRATKPRFMTDSAELVSQLRKFPVGRLEKLMSISGNLAQLNHDRFAEWEEEATRSNARPALLAFTGDVYQGMDLARWSQDDFETAQKRIRILSGLYGVLRPLDLMQPYRLEMGTKLANARGRNLYDFWGDTLTRSINADLRKSGSNHVVNLASNEYFSAIKPDQLKGDLVTPVFKDEKNGQFKIISFFAKKARGMMADFVVRNGVTDPSELKKFKTAGYRFSKRDSDASTLVFLRKEKVVA
jgi:cytoplasmic iron level regulating protein YaaA (DUF328/UPF0246 family)